MFIVDDPLLALIVRFVINGQELDASNEEFIKRQIQTLKAYVTQFPPEQQGSKAMEWIEQYAERYRKEWQKRAVTSRSTVTRCDDCPLKRFGTEEFCEIHEQWRYLLQCYVTDEIASKKYIKNALRLLKKHKKHLKHRQIPETAAPLTLPGVKESPG
jgi:hypothetical protein